MGELGHTRGSVIQWMRHTTQIMVLIVILAIPFLSHYRALMVQNKIEGLRSQQSPSWPTRMIMGLDEAVNTSTFERESLVKSLGKIQGNHWSAQIFRLHFIDPLAALESVTASRAISWTLLAGLILPLGITLILGKVFCSWVCPAGFLFEMSDNLRRRLPSWLQSGRGQKKGHRFKYILLLVGLMISFLAGMPLLGYFYPPAVLGREISFTYQNFFQSLVSDPTSPPALFLSGLSLFLLGIVVFEWLVSSRAWCRYVCPGGALYSLLGSKRLIRLKNRTSQCTECGQCVTACPVGLNPMRGEFGMECDHCLACFSTCKPGAIQFVIGPRGHNSNRLQTASKSSDRGKEET